jgi:hypothetical protein
VVALWFDRDVGNFLSVDWAPDGRAVVTGDRRGRVAVWDIDPEQDRWDDATIAQFARTSYEGQASWFGSHPTLTSRTPRWSESGHGVVWNARWAPDGSRVAAAGTDGSLSVYDASTGEVLSRQMMPKAGSLNGLAWHPGSRWLAAGGSDDRIYVYDTQANVPYDVLEGHDDLVSRAEAWSPDGATLASTTAARCPAGVGGVSDVRIRRSAAGAAVTGQSAGPWLRARRAGRASTRPPRTERHRRLQQAPAAAAAWSSLRSPQSSTPPTRMRARSAQWWHTRRPVLRLQWIFNPCTSGTHCIVARLRAAAGSPSGIPRRSPLPSGLLRGLLYMRHIILTQGLRGD